MGTFRYIGTAALIARGLAALEHAVTAAAEDLVGRAQEAETAVRSGSLKAGLHAEPTQTNGVTVTAVVATGGESDAYSAYIHEGHRQDGSHVIQAYPEGLQYLERPLIENRPVYLEHLARRAREAF